MAEETPRLESETAHILFMDVVSYSLLPMEKQNAVSQQLMEAVSATSEYKRATERNELVCLDTGDGLILIFARDPVAPVICAIEVAQAVGATLPMRIGINSGHVSRIRDINGQVNIRGTAINMAQRIMNCGDAGHILISARDAEDLISYEQWKSKLFDLGECCVKHDLSVHVYNLYTGTAGNKAVPTKMLESHKPAVVPPPPGGGIVVPPAGGTALPPTGGAGVTQPGAQAITTEASPKKVAILYKRHSPNDEYVRNLLEKQLTEAGYEVFIDLHMPIGVDWVREIDRQINTADAIIPLLSAASVSSDMMEMELETAHHAAQRQHGKPLLLPVRLGYHETLTGMLATILNPYQYAAWESEADDAPLAQAVLHSLKNPPAPQIPQVPTLEAIGGAVPLDSKFYIERKADLEFETAIKRRDSIILIKGGRQMGKTSLLARGMQQAREAGVKVIQTDFQTFNESHMASLDALFLALATTIADQLDLDINPRKAWDPDLGPNMNLEYFLRRKVLMQMTEPLMWGLDEVDRLFTCSFGSEVFGLFRSWHNRRSLEPTGPWARLSMAIAYATEAHLFITDMNQSPFNVGTRLALDDFSLDQIGDLNERYGRPLKSKDELARFHQLLGGQPFLIRRGMDDMITHNISLPELEAQASRNDGLFGDHLRRLLASLLRDQALTQSVKALLAGSSLTSSDDFYRLRTAGLIAGDSVKDAHFRCQLYATYMEQHLQ